jgi:putative transposase
MAAIIHPLLTLLASLTRQELACQVTYLRAENQILRSRSPGRLQLNNQEKRKLLRHGKPLGARIKEVHSIVSYSIFRRWVREMEDGAGQAKPNQRNRPKNLADPRRPKGSLS